MSELDARAAQDVEDALVDGIIAAQLTDVTEEREALQRIRAGVVRDQSLGLEHVAFRTEHMLGMLTTLELRLGQLSIFLGAPDDDGL